MLRFSLLLLVFVSYQNLADQTIRLTYTFESQSIGALIDEFSATTGIKVERYWQNQAEIKVLMVEGIEKGHPPDAVLIPADHLGLFRIMGFSPIPAELQQSVKLSEGVWQTATVEGTVYGAPVMQGNHLMLYFNKALVSKPASTWAELAAQQPELQLAGVNIIGWDYQQVYYLLPFLSAMGGQPMTDGRLTLDTRMMVEALTAYRSLAEQGLIDPACDNECSYQRFVKGQMAYTINGDWVLRDLMSQLGDQLGIAILPTWQGKALRSMYSSHVLAFPNQGLSKSKQASLRKLIRFMQSPAVQQRLWQELKVFPVEAEAFAMAKASIAPGYAAIFAQLQQATILPVEPAMTYAWGSMTKALERYLNGVMSAQEAAALMQRLTERELAKDQ